MRKVKLFIAMSVDGHEDCLENESTYSEFIKNIDTVLMGWNTYNQIITELSPDNWVYDNLLTYVFTHREQQDSDKIIFTSDNLEELIKKLKGVEGKDIWICGGADLVQQAISSDVIDEYLISIVPTILGNGIKLFSQNDAEHKLKLIKTITNNGIVELNYIRR